MPFQPKVSTDRIAAILADYQAGLPMKQIKERNGVTLTVIHYYADKAGLPKRKEGRPRVADPKYPYRPIRLRMAAVRAPDAPVTPEPTPPPSAIIGADDVQVGSLGAAWNQRGAKVVKAFGARVPLTRDEAREQITRQLANQNGRCATHKCAAPLESNRAYALYNETPHVLKIVCAACAMKSDPLMR